MSETYDVKIWTTEKYVGKRVTTYRVIWVVAGQRWKEGFRTTAAAESFRSELMAAQRKGEAFDAETGRPMSSRPMASRMNWYEFACLYVDMKWPGASPKHRKAIAEALVTVTPVMLDVTMDPVEAKAVRSALLNWGFNTRRRGSPAQPDEVTLLLAYVSRAARPVTDLARPPVVRKALETVATKLDGTRAAGSTARMKRVVLSNALSYAVEQEILRANLVSTIKWRAAPRKAQAVDRRVVVNPEQARALLEAVGTVQRSGPHLVAFFGCLYYSALRPEEAVHLRPEHLELPDGEGWGWINLEHAGPEIDRQWTDLDSRRETRQLKHRAVGEGRRTPAPPQLVELLRRHPGQFGVDGQGLLFRGERGAALSGHTYRRVWDLARARTLNERQYKSPLASRPYDLRHAAVSTWLSAGVNPSQVAEWAGHSVDVLLKTYAKCLDDAEEHAVRKIAQALVPVPLPDDVQHQEGADPDGSSPIEAGPRACRGPSR